MNSAANTPNSGGFQSIWQPISIAEQDTLQPPSSSTSVAAPPTISASSTLTPTSPQEGTCPHDSETPPLLQNDAFPLSMASSGSHQTPGGGDPSTHPLVNSESTVNHRPPQTSNIAGSSGDNDGEDSLSSKKPCSELNPTTASPVKNDNVHKEEKSNTDQPPPTHEEEMVFSLDSSQSGALSAPSPSLSEDSSSDYDTPPPSPTHLSHAQNFSHLSSSSATLSSTSFSPQPTNEDQNTDSTTNETDVKSENVASSKPTLSENSSSKEEKPSAGPKLEVSKVAGDEVQGQDGSQSVTQLQSQSNNVDNTTTSSTTNKQKGNGIHVDTLDFLNIYRNGNPPDSASNPSSDTSQPNNGGTEVGAGAGLDNKGTSQKVSVLCFIVIYTCSYYQIY